MIPSTTTEADDTARKAAYREVRERLEALLDGEDDWVSAMATVACELHHSFEHYDWTGFYRVIAPNELAIGPYQGGHGCLRIAFSRGVCGKTARTGQTQLIDDVNAIEDHIACSTTTRSEIVVPIHAPSGELVAVLDVDSDRPAAFSKVDQRALESLCGWLAKRFG